MTIKPIFGFVLTTILMGQSPAFPASLDPGVVVDTERDRIYVADPEGVIEARDLESGEAIWSSEARGQPLAMTSGLLFAQAESDSSELNLLGVAIGTGNLETRRTVQLPHGVRACLADTLACRFTIHAYLFEDRLYLLWNHVRLPVRGAFEADGQDKDDTPTASRGAIVYDPVTGNASGFDAQDLPADLRDVMQFFLAEELEPGERLSADREHTLRYEAIADNRTWDRYQWTIVERRTEREVGRIRSHLPEAPFIVDEGIIIYVVGPYARRVEGEMREEPLSLRAVDLDTGRSRWVRELYDPGYRGPFPP